jgi:hypothetical protein
VGCLVHCSQPAPRAQPNILIQQYGPEDALLFAARRADALLELGDVGGQRDWKGVLRAIEELVRVERKVDETARTNHGPTIAGI